MKEKYKENIKAFLALVKLALNELHYYLVKFRVLSIGVTAFSGWLLLDAWQFYKLHYSEYEEWGSAVSIGVFITGYMAMLKWAFDYVVRKHEGHGE